LGGILEDIESLLTKLGLPIVVGDSLLTANVRLWPGIAPGFVAGDEGVGEEIIDQPMVSIHLAKDGNGCGVVVCPGGGYRSLASDHEGLQVAHWLNAQGVHAFVLRYRLGPKYHSSISLIDGLRCLRLVRYYASELTLDPRRIGMLGFSAGGHLALAVGNHQPYVAVVDGAEGVGDPIDAVSSRPDFVVPVYAVTNGAVRGRKADEYLPTDTSVTANTPPTFIVHTHQDSVVPASQSTLVYDALLKAGVAAELHIFNHGDHGLGLAVDEPDVGQWTELLLRWLRRHGYFAAQDRVAIQGQLLAEDKSLGIAAVTFIPENQDHPIAHARIVSSAGGEFSIPLNSGPVLADYRVVVHLLSAQYPPATTGLYTQEQPTVYQAQLDLAAGLGSAIDNKLLLKINADELVVSVI